MIEPSGKKDKRRHTGKQPAIQTRFEISNQHVGEWVLMQVTGYTEWGETVGYVLATSPDKEPLHARLFLLPKEQRQGLSLFRGRLMVNSGPELEEAAREVVRQFQEAKQAAGNAGQ